MLQRFLQTSPDKTIIKYSFEVMMIKKLLLLLVTLSLVFTFTENIFAGVTGKISGKVTSSETGEELIGINIVIEGTTMGAASGLDGSYIINNVEPGTYTLIVSGIGFQKQRIENVKVTSDFTTNVDVKLSSDVVTLDAVVVQAEAPMIRKDLTSSRTTVDASQIEALPVESIDQLLMLQAGITRGAGGTLHIRGGRSTEIAYTVNGVSISNPFDNSRTVEISTNAIQELSVVSGTFNAEYGNALSGVVNTITKEGGNNYKAYLSFYTGDYISSNDNIFYNIDDLDPLNNMVSEGTLSGPVPLTGNAVTFFLSGRYNNNQGYLYGIRQHLPVDSVFKSQSSADDIRLSQSGDFANVPMNTSEDINSTAKLTFKPFSTLKINYDVVYSNSDYKTYNHEIKYNPDANYNRYEWGLLNSLEARHALSNNTFYSLKGSYNIYDFKRYLYPLLDPVSGKAVSFRPGMNLESYRPDPRYQPDYKYNTKVAEYTFVSGGTLNGHFYQRAYTYEGKFDINSQVNNNHEVKMGLHGKYHEMNYVDFDVLRDSTLYRDPTIPPLNSSRRDEYAKYPLELSGYIQDKMEFENLVLNVGVRYDYFNSNSVYSTNQDYPSPYGRNIPAYIDKSTLLADAPAKHMVSPRLGLSFPITDRGIIHFSYGHFYQIPPYSFLYTNPHFEAIVGSPIYGNANLRPEQTVSYEIGLQQQLSENLAFNVTGFYKDVRDLLALQEIRVSTSNTYRKYVNQDYGNIKGITFSLSKRRTPSDMLSVTVDYTFQTAEGNETGSAAFFIDRSSGRQSEKLPVPLDWDQTHTLNATASIGVPRNWNLTVVSRLGTGLPYTPQMTSTQIFLRTNSSRRPFQTTVDLLAEKSFDLYSVGLTLFLKVFNLFDTLNERFVFNDTGRATYTLEEGKGTAQEANRLAGIIPGAHSATEYFVRPQYYAPPREVRFGMSIDL
jgi:outer membrane receptor protein involved in Fe transport